MEEKRLDEEMIEMTEEMAKICDERLKKGIEYAKNVRPIVLNIEDI